MARSVSGSDGERLDGLTSWYSSWHGLRVAVLGIGMTGFSVADTLAELGADVLVVAREVSADRIKLLDVIGVRYAQADLDEGPGDELVAHNPELVIVSPGFRPDAPALEWARSNNVAVWGDVELAWRLRDKTGAPAQWILVTGTNGKTTTVQLTATMLAAAGYKVAPCGNIGVPVLDAVRDPNGFDFFVVELSSYQLHWLNRGTVGDVVPHASVCLNVQDDHLDWHGGAQQYRMAKAKVYENTLVACVYNKADETTEAMVREADVTEGARAIGFGLDSPGLSDLGVVDGILCDRAFLDERATQALEITTLDELSAVGLAAPHMVANTLAASALARSAGVDPDIIARSLQRFTVDEHRCQLVAESQGVRWVDDSKATNPHAADASLRAFDSIVWILGGLLKGVQIDDLVSGHGGRLRGAVLIGEDREILRDAFRRHAPHVPLREVDSTETREIMSAAVEFAAGLASSGDVVLLAPAAASMDQFADYADRGRRFTEAVKKFVGGDVDDTSASQTSR